MHLNELLCKEIKVDFDKDLHISEARIKKYIHKWPEQIYNIIIQLQKKGGIENYLFTLPSHEGTLEFNLNKKTKKIDITFHKKGSLTQQKKFKTMLGEIYRDISAEEEELDSLRHQISDTGIHNLDQLDKLLNDSFL